MYSLLAENCLLTQILSICIEIIYKIENSATRKSSRGLKKFRFQYFCGLRSEDYANLDIELRRKWSEDFRVKSCLLNIKASTFRHLRRDGDRVAAEVGEQDSGHVRSSIPLDGGAEQIVDPCALPGDDGLRIAGQHSGQSAAAVDARNAAGADQPILHAALPDRLSLRH